MAAYIEDLRFDCKLLPNLNFNEQFGDSKAKFNFRKANLKTTQCLWLTMSPVIDYGFTLYNPKCLVLIILN